MNLRTRIESFGVAVHGPVQRLRAVRTATWLKIAACVVVAFLFAAELALRGEAVPPEQKRVAGAIHLRGNRHATPASAEGVPADVAAARKGDSRALNRLLAMTRAQTCESRTQAAEALAGVRNPKAIAALKKLANSTFKDESASPGIFSCSSRRAAQRALEQLGT